MWEHIDSSGGEDACWPCDYGLGSGGHPVITIKLGYRKYTQRKVHRLVYQEVVGPILPGQYILQSCGNPKCCNPKHLVAGEMKEVFDSVVLKKMAEWLDAWYMACSPTSSVEAQPTVG